MSNFSVDNGTVLTNLDANKINASVLDTTNLDVSSPIVGSTTTILTNSEPTNFTASSSVVLSDFLKGLITVDAGATADVDLDINLADLFDQGADIGIDVNNLRIMFDVQNNSATFETTFTSSGIVTMTMFNSEPFSVYGADCEIVPPSTYARYVLSIETISTAFLIRLI